MNKYKQSKLSNGLTFITAENHNSDVVNVSFVIKAGSRYEQSSERGYAHFLEHILFQGTKKSPSPFEINRIIERSGAWFSASTSVEVISISATVVKNYLEKIFGLMIEMAIEPIINEGILENEKKVVVQELKQSLDNKGSRLWIESAKRIFAGHPLSHYPIGEEKDILGATSEKLKDYRDRFFTSDRMAIVMIGDIDHEKLACFIEEKMGMIKKSSDKQISDIAMSPTPEKGKAFIQMPGAQTHLAFNFLIPECSFRESAILNIIVNYLGYRHTSLLYQEIRHKLGLVYSIGVFDLFFKDAALIYISTSTTFPDKVAELMLDKVSNIKEYLDENTFREYREQVVNIQKRKLSNPFAEVLFLSNNWNLYNRLITPQEMKEVIEGVSYRELIELAEKYLNKDNLLIVTLGEKNSSV